MAKFELAFAKSTCPRCRAPERVVAVACPECGNPPKPHEVNIPVQRRRVIVERAREVWAKEVQIESTALRPFYEVHESLFERSRDVFTDLLEALARVSRENTPAEAVQTLRSKIGDFRRLESELECRDRRRPNAATLDLLRAVVAETREAVAAYFDALAAPTMLEAQRLGEQAQDRIDAASKLLDDASFVQRAADALASADILTVGGLNVIEALRMRYPARSFGELEQLGQVEHDALVGTAAAPGFGVELLILLLVADVHLAPERFRHVLRKAASVCRSSTSALDRLASEPEILSDLRAAKIRALEAHVRLDRLIRPGIHDEAALRGIFRLYAELFEEVGLPIMASFLLLTGQRRKPYAALRQENSTELARSVAADQTLQPLFRGADKNLRNAADHGHSYRIEHDEIVFELRSYQARLRIEDFVDTCFTLVESLYALLHVLDNEIALRGHDEHQVNDLRQYGLSGDQMAVFSATSIGAEVREVRQEGLRWILDLGSFEKSKLVLASVLLDYAPAGISEIAVHYSEGSVRHVLTVMFDALRGYAESSNADVLDLLNLLETAKVDAAPCLDVDQLRTITAREAIPLLTGNDVRGIPTLRALREIAKRLDDKELADRLTEIIRWLRVGVGEGRKDAGLKEVADVLSGWIRGPIPQIP